MTADDEKLRRTIVTPEGIPVDFTLAQAGDRAVAFLIDVLIMFGALVALYALIHFGGGARGDSLAVPVLMVVAFFVQSFYFIFFEVRWQGATPGKRAVSIRVIDARGGVLTAGAVLARNLVRDLEVWVPLQLIVGGEMVWPDAPPWTRIVATSWALVFMLLPLFNKDRLRVGDLVGGTRVVKAPKVVLLPDVVDEGELAARRRRDAPAHLFTDAQLDVYGIYELQVLEGVLRQPPSPSQQAAVLAVYDKITAKIGWTPPPGRFEHERVLKDFYAALRARLEGKALLGQRKQDKFSR